MVVRCVFLFTLFFFYNHTTCILHLHEGVCTHLGTSTFEGAFIDLQTRVLPPRVVPFYWQFLHLQVTTSSTKRKQSRSDTNIGLSRVMRPGVNTCVFWIKWMNT